MPRMRDTSPDRYQAACLPLRSCVGDRQPGKAWLIEAPGAWCNGLLHSQP